MRVAFTFSSPQPRSVGDGATDFMRFMPTVPGEGGEKLRRLRWFLPPRRGSFPKITLDEYALYAKIPPFVKFP